MAYPRPVRTKVRRSPSGQYMAFAQNLQYNKPVFGIPFNNGMAHINRFTIREHLERSMDDIVKLMAADFPQFTVVPIEDVDAFLSEHPEYGISSVGSTQAFDRDKSAEDQVGEMREELKEVAYKDLQTKASKLGIGPVNIKAELLIEQIIKAELYL